MPAKQLLYPAGALYQTPIVCEACKQRFSRNPEKFGLTAAVHEVA